MAMGGRVLGVTAVLLAWTGGPLVAQPLGAAFTHQGRLTDGGTPASGPYDFRCILYDAAAGGAQVGPIVALEDVAVADGLFTVALDFGAAFRGSARWLEIAVRPGASTGAYTVVDARQELKPAPNAIFSASAADVSWTGVSGKPAGFADNVDNDSGGTVTAVATGAGLTGGPITGTGTVSVATGGIVSGMIANGAVGASQINQAQVQTRINGTCPLGSYLRGINPDGTVVCTGIPNPHAITTLAKPGTHAVGRYPAIAIMPDGLPVISFYGEINGGALHFTKCANAACTAPSVYRTLDDSVQNDVGTYSAIAIGSDGFPVVSYHDATAGTLKVAKCQNASCTFGLVVTTVDDHPVNTVGAHTSIAVGTDGFPIISYYDSTAGGLKVAKCINLNCTGLNVITTVDNPANDVGRNTSIGIGTDDLPVISYRDATAGLLKVAKCGSAACNTGATITTVATGVGGGRGQMVVPADGRPVIAYEATVAQDSAIRIVRCGNAACSAGNVDHELYFASGLGGALSSIAIGADGLPVVSHWGPALRVSKCGDAACSAGNLSSILDSPADAGVGNFSAIARGADGLPVVAYSDVTNGSLKVAKCGNAACN
jgi:hypothetical protein